MYLGADRARAALTQVSSAQPQGATPQTSAVPAAHLAAVTPMGVAAGTAAIRDTASRVPTGALYAGLALGLVGVAAHIRRRRRLER